MTATARTEVKGHAVTEGDVLHDHDDAVVLAVTHEACIATATVRYTGGGTGKARWGLEAVMDVSRPLLAVTCRPCGVCGTAATVHVDPDAHARWLAGALVQDAFPGMDANTRELLVSGTHAACWDAMFDGCDE